MSADVEKIKERLSIVDVISSYIKVEKAGINFKARCPFHNEKTPSFMISPQRQSFYCFGCGEKGDIFSFVEKFEGLDFRGALESLAARAGIELKRFDGKKENRDEKDKLLEIMEQAAQFYEENLKNQATILEYLRDRGLSDASINKWRLGFAPEGWRNLYDYLTQKGYAKKELLEAGLIKKVENEEKYYDTFRGRVMFPINDPAGRVIAFSGRAMKEDAKTPKYLNSPETKLFYKSEVLYGLDAAKNHIHKLDYAVLVEGQMDLIMSHQAGVSNTVASSGTALTETHLKKIQRLSNRVIMAYDSDPAGQKAARRAAELALSLGMESKIASLPQGEDPASVIKKDPDEWKSALKKSEHFTDFALSQAISGGGKNMAKEILKNVLPLVNLLSSDMEKSQFIRKIALKINVDEESVRNDAKKLASIQKTGRTPDETDWHGKQSKKVNLDRIMASFVYLQENSQNKGDLRQKWQALSGHEEVERTLASYDKDREALIFEAEEHAAGELGPVADDILRRIELQALKQRFKEAAMRLDQKSINNEDKKNLEVELKKIEQRIKEISF